MSKGIGKASIEIKGHLKGQLMSRLRGHRVLVFANQQDHDIPVVRHNVVTMYYSTANGSL